MTANQSNMLGEILIKSNLLTEEQLVAALGRQKEVKKRLGNVLVEMGFVKESDIMMAYSKQLNIPFIADLEDHEPDSIALRIIPAEMARRFITLPLSFHDTYITAVVADPTDNTLSSTIEFATGRHLKYVLSTPTTIFKAINRFYEGIVTENIGELLLKAGKIQDEQLKEVLAEQKNTGRRLGELIVLRGYASERDVAEAFSKQFSIPHTDLSIEDPQKNAIELIPAGLARKHTLVPLSVENGVLTIVMADPLDIKTINALSVATGMYVKATVASESEIREAIEKGYKGTETDKLGDIAVSTEYIEDKPAETTKKLRGMRLSELLVSSGLLTEKKLAELIEKGKEQKTNLIDIIVDQEYVTESQIAIALSEIYGIPFVELSDVSIKPQVINQISENIATKYMLIPTAVEGRTITIAMCNPGDIEAIDAIQFATGKKLKLTVSTPLDILKAIHIFYRGGQARRIGDIMVEMGVLTPEQLQSCLAQQKSCKKKIGQILLEQNFIKEIDLYRAFAIQLGIPFIDLSNLIPDPMAVKLIPEDIINNNLILPISLSKQTLTVVAHNPFNSELIANIRRISGKNISVAISSPAKLREAIKNFFEPPDELSNIDTLQDITDNLEFLDSTPSEDKEDVGAVDFQSAPIVRITDSLLIHALQTGASDIHLEPQYKVMVVRNRIDGMLREIKQIPISAHRAVVSRIKIMADMDIAQRRLPQDGKMKFRYKNKTVEIRVATLPTPFGESVVMRILAAGEPMPLDRLNLLSYNQSSLMKVASKPYGLILVVGPTGSGKTTTLHSILGHINTPERKIWTAENPIEITQRGLNQVEIKPLIDLTFAQAMRAFLRADPDVIMVGEMRDLETAHIAVEASLTGHLVLSTLHTNSAPDTIMRLLDIGINRINFSDSILGILAQRLVRKLCPNCKIPYRPSQQEIDELIDSYGREFYPEEGFDLKESLTLYRKGQCEQCGGIGYKGRTGIHEFLDCNEQIRGLIRKGATVPEIKKQGIQDGMRTMLQDGIKKVIAGQTDLSQIYHVCMT